jgi:hypothetical protein
MVKNKSPLYEKDGNTFLKEKIDPINASEKVRRQVLSQKTPLITSNKKKETRGDSFGELFKNDM